MFNSTKTYAGIHKYAMEVDYMISAYWVSCDSIGSECDSKVDPIRFKYP